MTIDDTTPIAALTVGDFKELMHTLRQQPREEARPEVRHRRYVYGLQGIRDIFGCSHATAQRYKDTIIRDAVIQNGRKIVVDVELALQLFNQNGRDAR